VIKVTVILFCFKNNIYNFQVDSSPRVYLCELVQIFDALPLKDPGTGYSRMQNNKAG